MTPYGNQPQIKTDTVAFVPGSIRADLACYERLPPPIRARIRSATTQICAENSLKEYQKYRRSFGEEGAIAAILDDIAYIEGEVLKALDAQRSAWKPVTIGSFKGLFARRRPRR